MATPRTGRPRGRPKGSKTLHKRREKPRVEHVEAQVEEKIAKILGPDLEPFKGGAVEFLMSVYKDPTVPRHERVDAAKAAAKFESPALQAITMTTKDPFLEIEDPDELRRALAAETARLAIVAPPNAGGARAAGGKPKPVRH